MRLPLLAKLVSTYLVPMLALAVLGPLLAWTLARQSLEDEVGKRLVASASVAAAQLRADTLLTLQPGDEGNRTHKNLTAKLEGVRSASNAARVYAFDLDERLLLGAGGEPPPIGSPLPDLARDRLELERVKRGTASASAVTFVGTDGVTYKSGYAPVLDADGKVVALVGADASAEFFAPLRRLARSLAILALVCAALGLALYFLAGSRLVLQPIRRLLAATERIGKGDLATAVPVQGDDELATLARGLEQMREKLYGRERELQMMLQGIAHEVRNPLGGIELFAGLLAEEVAGDEEKLAHVRKIQRELSYLERVVQEFLDYARDPKLDRQPIDARALCAELEELAAGDAAPRAQRLVVRCEPLTFDGDPHALKRAVLNLLRNAIQASPPGTTIEVRVRRDGDAVCCSVADEGPGVPAEVRAQLFTPFFTTKEKGLGLGLAFVRRIAEAHGGTVVLEPAEKGAVFTLRLPAAARAVAA